MTENGSMGGERRWEQPSDEGFIGIDVSPPSEPPAGNLPNDRGFFGQPMGLMTLFFTEAWERFSYYGMRAILFLYLTDLVVNGGLGIVENTGVALVAVYGTGVYLLSVVGGWLADRVMGAWRAVLYGGIVIALGHLLLTIPSGTFSFIGIAFVAIGTGLLKPNVSSMVGDLYARNDSRRDAGFSIYYVGINLGSFFSPIIVGAVQAAYGYHWGFSVAAVGMALALVFFVGGRRFLGMAGAGVPNPVRPGEWKAIMRVFAIVVGAVLVMAVIAYLVVLAKGVASDERATTTFIDTLSYVGILAPVAYLIVMYRSPKVTEIERPRVLAYIPLFIAAAFFWFIFEQASNTLTAFAKNNTIMATIDLGFVRYTFNEAAFQSINPLTIMILAPLFAWIWVRTKDRPPTAYKFALGLMFAGLSFVFLAVACVIFDATDPAATTPTSPTWVLVVVYVIQTLGELCISPVGLAATTLLAPRAFKGQAMALWFLAVSAGTGIAAQLILFTPEVSNTVFFGISAGIGLVVAVVTFALAPWVTRHIRKANELEGLAAEH